MFRNDHNGRRRDRHTRILVGGGLDTARHHQADMDAVLHPVGIDAGEQPFDKLIGRHVHLEIERTRAFIEAGQMGPLRR